MVPQQAPAANKGHRHLTILALLWLFSPTVVVGALRQTSHSSTTAHIFNPQHWLRAAADELKRQDGAWKLASSAECSSRYGAGYLARWRKLSGDFCGDSSSSSSRIVVADAAAEQAPSSWVRCYAHPAKELTGCVAANMIIDSAALMGTSRQEDALPQARPGAVRLGCQAVPDDAAQPFLRGRLRREGMRRWLVQARAAAPAPPAAMQASCGGASTLLVRHPVLLLLRLDEYNAFHHLEFVVSLFAALAVMQQVLPGRIGADPRQQWQVVIADDRKPGPYIALWRRLAAGRPVRFLRTDPYPNNTCLARAMLAPFSGHMQSLLTYMDGGADSTDCPSLVVRATALWMHSQFQDVASTASPPPPMPLPQLLQLHQQQQQGSLKVLWVSRKRHEQRLRDKGRLTAWQLARLLPNEAQAVEALNSTVATWNARACGGQGGGARRLRGELPCRSRFELQVRATW